MNKDDDKNTTKGLKDSIFKIRIFSFVYSSILPDYWEDVFE